MNFDLERSPTVIFIDGQIGRNVTSVGKAVAEQLASNTSVLRKKEASSYSLYHREPPRVVWMDPFYPDIPSLELVHNHVGLMDMDNEIVDSIAERFHTTVRESQTAIGSDKADIFVVSNWMGFVRSALPDFDPSMPQDSRSNGRISELVTASRYMFDQKKGYMVLMCDPSPPGNSSITPKSGDVFRSSLAYWNLRKNAWLTVDPDLRLHNMAVEPFTLPNVVAETIVKHVVNFV